LLARDHIVGLHVRAIDKAETAKEGESHNAIRSAARLTRRSIRRRAYRLLRLRRLLKREGLIASHDPAQFDSGVSPWQFRTDGLDRKLEDSEWAIVLYHIIKHRGFQSNRKSEAKFDEKTGEMLSGVTANQQRMQNAGWRTVGEMAERDPAFANAKRNKCGSYTHTFSRADLKQELRELFKQQRIFGNPHASAAFEQAVETLLLARKPTLSGTNLLKMVGHCTFEAFEFRAPKASHTAEHFCGSPV
jgi:CRISPR-associated endonuclease Csn1